MSGRRNWRWKGQGGVRLGDSRPALYMEWMISILVFMSGNGYNQSPWHFSVGLYYLAFALVLDYFKKLRSLWLPTSTLPLTSLSLVLHGRICVHFNPPFKEN